MERTVLIVVAIWLLLIIFWDDTHPEIKRFDDENVTCYYNTADPSATTTCKWKEQ